MLLEDETLVKRSLDGDNDAFTRLVGKYQNMVFCCAFSVLENFHDAEDIVQETFLKAYISLRQLSNAAKFRGWLYGIARNLSYNLRKRKSKQVVSSPDVLLEDMNRMSLEKHRDEELSTELKDAIASISEKQRAPLLLSLAGYSYQEISGFLGVRESTVRGRIARAKQSLKSIFLNELEQKVNAHKFDEQYAQGIMAMIRQLPINPVPPQAKSTPRRIVPISIIGLLAIIAIALSALYVAPWRGEGLTYEWTRTLVSDWTSSGNRVVYNPNDGHIYTTGFFANTVDFEPSDGIENHKSSGWVDWYVWKLDSSGLYGNGGWSLVGGGPEGHDIIYDIAFDRDNNLYIAGSIDTAIGLPNIFIAKYNQDRQVQWAHAFDDVNSIATSLALSSDHKSIFITGRFRDSIDFDPGVGSDIHISDGFWDVFVMKLSIDGDYLWTKQFGGVGEVQGKNITVDINDNIYISGVFNGILDFDDFDLGPGRDNHTSKGSNDVFIMNLKSDGSLAWAKTFGGTGNDMVGYKEGGSMLVAKDMMYLVGRFEHEVDFDPGVGVDMRTPNGKADAYILSLDLNGNYNWVKTFGGSKSAVCEGITRWKEEIYVTGHFAGTVDFDPGTGVDEHTAAGDGDLFIAKYDSKNDYLWTKTVGSPTGIVNGHSIAIDNQGGIYVSGDFKYVTDFNPDSGSDVKKAWSADLSAFLTKFTLR